MPVQRNPEAGPWTPRDTGVLTAVAALGLAWRLYVALTAPWYWDEGYVAELARALGSFTRPHVGGLWEDGFFPLSTSFLAPLSAMPFACAPWWSAMTGVRVWSVLLECLALVLVALLARDRGAPRRALWAAACYAFLPFAAEFGGRAFYHHLAVVFLLAALGAGRTLFDPEKTAKIVPASLCAGLAAATCYWVWWLPLTWVAVLAWKRPRNWAWGLLWTALPPLIVLAVNVQPDPQGAWWSIRGMLLTSGAAGPRGGAAWLAALTADFWALPFLAVGLLGLARAAVREKGPWIWYLACLIVATLDPIRQRGNISGMPYPFLLAAPLAALGAAYLADEALRLRTWRGWLATGAVLAVFFQPVNLSWLRLWSFTPGQAADLKAFFDRDARPGDAVCGLPNFNWTLRPGLRVCEPADLVAADGRAAGFFVAGAPASRFAFPCGVSQVRYAVVSRIHLLGLFRFEGVALTFLEMERGGWRLVFDDKTFKVYENPGFGVSPDPNARILEIPDYYRIARDQAARAGRTDLVRFADERLGIPGKHS